MESMYDKIGEENLKSILEDFYTQVFDNPVLKPLFKGEKSLILHKQQLFLTQLLGGPTLYNNEYGHPRMRMRHMPFKIDETAMMEWLKCMKLAISRSNLEENLKASFYNIFPNIAMHMVNHK